MPLTPPPPPTYEVKKDALTVPLICIFCGEVNKTKSSTNLKRKMQTCFCLTLFGLGGGGGGGKMVALRVFAKYLKNGLVDLQETL